jgi:hypothetical protein
MANTPLVGSEGVHLVDMEREYAQHDDDDVIIPDHLSKWLVLSAQLLLVSAIFAFVYGFTIMGCLLLAVYITSIWHWRAPRFSSWARLFDYGAVAAAVVYASYLSTTLGEVYTVTWFAGLGCIASLFATNEYAYYVQVGRDPSGGEGTEGKEGASNNLLGLPYAARNTKEREGVFRRTVIVHVIAVHVAANALALTIIFL